MLQLKAHHSNATTRQITCSIQNEGEYICINYEFINVNPCVNKDFCTDDFRKNSGLWDYDVVEAFLSFSDSRYLEVQLSPLGQCFSYLVTKPRELFSFPDNLDVKYDIAKNDDKLNIALKINRKCIPGDGNKLMGNIFVCLGPKDKREYYALNINDDEIPDFHRPDLFKELL